MPQPSDNAVITVEQIRHHDTWPALRAFVTRAARQGDEGPVMAAWTTLSHGRPQDLAYWRRAVPAALGAFMADRGTVSPPAWRGIALMLSLSEDDLKDRVSHAIQPDPHQAS